MRSPLELVDEPFDGKPPMLLEGNLFEVAIDAGDLDMETGYACNGDVLARCGGRMAGSSRIRRGIKAGGLLDVVEDSVTVSSVIGIIPGVG